MYLNKELAKALKTLIEYNTGARDFTLSQDAKELNDALVLLEQKVSNK
tara:strand:- start:3164 stop:3307 length:144 start_codon:yes stop_codon:yes gene_type:complete